MTYPYRVNNTVNIIQVIYYPIGNKFPAKPGVYKGAKLPHKLYLTYLPGA